MSNYIIFYATSSHYNSVVIEAKSFTDAVETSQVFSRGCDVIILGVFLQSSYLKLHPNE